MKIVWANAGQINLLALLQSMRMTTMETRSTFLKLRRERTASPSTMIGIESLVVDRIELYAEELSQTKGEHANEDL